MQFKVDSSGIIINNWRMYMSSDVGHMRWDAKHGFFAGTKDLFVTTDTGHVLPTCIDTDGSMKLDADGFPEDSPGVRLNPISYQGCFHTRRESQFHRKQSGKQGKCICTCPACRYCLSAYAPSPAGTVSPVPSVTSFSSTEA